jgi:shikimate dehydrogenase
MTILAGVIGDPISHSRSPRLMAHWLRRYDIAGHYVPYRVRPDDLEDALRLLPRLGLRGLNVTIPHKEAAFRLADRVTDRARAVEAANTLTFTDDGLHADNTDGMGFVASLRQGAPDWDPTAPALVLGAGGAARGIVAALLAAGGRVVTVANRTASRARALAALFDDRVGVIPWDDVPAGLADHALLVNTTSLGMIGQPSLSLPLDGLPNGAIVTDIVYTPLETPLLADARGRGLVAVDGLGMLLHQAAPGFARWYGILPEVDDALRQAVLG